MAIPFSQNVSEAIAYSNASLKTFSNWLLAILMTFFVFVGVVVTFCGIGMITASAILMSLPETFSVLTAIITAISDSLVQLFGIFASSIMTAGIITTIVGIVITALFSFWLSGLVVRGAAPEDATLAHPGRLLGQGFMANIILLVYCIPAIIISIIINLGPMDNLIYLILVGFLVQFIFIFLSLMAGYMAIAAYANEGRLGAAFSIPSVCSAVSRFGWLRLFGHFLLLTLLITVVMCVLVLIPIIGWLLLLFVIPFIQVLTGRFMGNAYRST